MQTYTRRNASKEQAKQTEGVQHSDQDSKTGRETTKMALPQFEREKKNYTPSKCYLKCGYNTVELHHQLLMQFAKSSLVCECDTSNYFQPATFHTPV